MFDLFRSRAKATRYLLGGLLLLVALSMVVTLIPGYGTPSANDTVVAEIGKEPLSARDVQLRIQTALRDKSIPPDLAPILLPQFINEMIADRALEYEAQQHGLQVTDAEVATSIRSLIPQLYQDGKFVGNEAYAGFLSQQNMTISQFESTVRRQMMVTKFQNLALEGMIVTPLEIEQEFRGQNQKAKLDYIALSGDQYRSQVKLTPEDVQSFFKSHPGQFRVPEKRDAVLIVADQAKMEAGFTLSDDQLRQIYTQDRERFRVPDRVHPRHILLKTMDKPKEEVAKLQAKAEDLLKQIKGGADFAALAKKYSDDPGSATKGGDLDWITKDQTVKNFEAAAFSLKPKEISGVIKTEYGFHIIQVLEKDTARVKPFEEVKDTIASERKRQVVVDRMQTLADQARAQLAANPGQAEQIARKLGLEFTKVEGWAPGAALPLLGVARDAQDVIATLGKGDVSPVVQPSPDKLAIIEVTAISPARD
ncbi:MAG: peptidylprolyl isomerase, partial [Acidobacteria bacterium]|nr:peptidylprolyl isomerase [Acidobacteriota bacterium]